VGHLSPDQTTGGESAERQQRDHREQRTARNRFKLAGVFRGRFAFGNSQPIGHAFPSV
jgi:hypothetical protein